MRTDRWYTPDRGDWTYGEREPLCLPVWGSLSDLRAANKRHGNHFFDDDTMAFFGSTRQELVAGAVIVERQGNAPEGVDPWVSVPFNPDANDLGITCRHKTRQEAIRCALAIVNEGFSR